MRVGDEEGEISLLTVLFQNTFIQKFHALYIEVKGGVPHSLYHSRPFPFYLVWTVCIPYMLYIPRRGVECVEVKGHTKGSRTLTFVSILLLYQKFLPGKSFALSPPCSQGKFYSTNFLSYVNDYMEPIAILTVRWVKIYSTKIYISVMQDLVGRLGKIFVQWKFLAVYCMILLVSACMFIYFFSLQPWWSTFDRSVCWRHLGKNLQWYYWCICCSQDTLQTNVRSWKVV